MPKFWLTNKRMGGNEQRQYSRAIGDFRVSKTYIFDLKVLLNIITRSIHGHTFTVLELDGKN